ncbi:hypothetical protein AQUCO_03100056v1 [Aquilegia coerulea]|uniref:WAT1-related protein n=1 Tax=Aquilegia coerulea TaxID=218851 RepID=A0A2G5D0K7_AQUCA|nr:hypothetical protein AQUCO_03100056v1 [Aquilegia coerulea]
MGWWEDNKPVIGMLSMQFSYAGVALLTRAALLQGMSPRVFVVYRQAIATLVIAPIAYFSKGKKEKLCLGKKSFSLIFLASLIGVTINQNIYFEGLYLASSSIASAMSNLVPGITFVMAAAVGLEKVDISLRSMAKVGGTLLCVGGAVSMAMIKGPKLLNIELDTPNSVLHSGGENWILGCLLLFGSCCCWSFWLILQVPVSVSYPDHLSLSAWMCFFATLQSGTLTFFLEPDPKAWNLHSSYQLFCCIFAGIVGSAISFFIQSWCVSKRGPLFSATFNPLATVIVTFLACLILHEELYSGSLAGAVAVVVGLYVVLWGKAKDLREMRRETYRCDDSTKIVEVSVDNTSEDCQKIDLEKPLLNMRQFLF